ncbi:hypothetical protein RhiirA4_423124 [Rhizophagus irregularis]|uniref:Uncharacterized protein n=1 Tax=Rhizophagus irregularis TaxID=588596 RepID=A0A2I1GSS9_9GLOM|nr:hypothetical protein RhiirA4_423124 [Rhizophagus irregularis]
MAEGYTFLDMYLGMEGLVSAVIKKVSASNLSSVAGTVSRDWRSNQIGIKGKRLNIKSSIQSGVGDQSLKIKSVQMINIPIPLVFLKETKSKNTEIPENKKKNKKKSYNLRKFLKEKLSKKEIWWKKNFAEVKLSLMRTTI